MKMGAGPMPTVADPAERAVLIRDAFRLEWLSIAWMVIEGDAAFRRAPTLQRDPVARLQRPGTLACHHRHLRSALLFDRPTDFGNRASYSARRKPRQYSGYDAQPGAAAGVAGDRAGRHGSVVAVALHDYAAVRCQTVRRFDVWGCTGNDHSDCGDSLLPALPSRARY